MPIFPQWMDKKLRDPAVVIGQIWRDVIRFCADFYIDANPGNGIQYEIIGMQVLAEYPRLEVYKSRRTRRAPIRKSDVRPKSCYVKIHSYVYILYNLKYEV